MPLDSFPSSSAVAVPPPPSTARTLSAGSPSSTAKVQAIVVEELALASMGVLDAAPEASPPDAGELVELWARTRTRKRASRLDAKGIENVLLVKSEWPPQASADRVASGRARMLAFAACAAVLLLGLLGLALR